ncbi:MAG TPA: hypothetical protein VHN14_14695 [Kofleriaceae bacterium]|jgi:hypothetical protein|nr:hypothetical protein [Kofleriaceae bacterium]
MITKTKLLAAVLSVSLTLGAGGIGCNSDDGNERWATTENTNVQIDWDKVNEAYKHADGPEDLERRINEIYEGSEIISISVQDVDDKTQVVTGFFDKDKDGKVSDPEKIFTIKRDLKGSEAQYQTQGYGPHYGYYTSPFFSIASGMLMGAMLSNMFHPSYTPMYTTAYTTSAARASQLGAHRSSYRAANPARFSKPSKSGRTYGGGSKSFGGASPSRGGSRFGVARRGRTVELIG